ncbi:alpha/beta hydrolase [Methylovulum psychrotolerans]|uniref:alpha/beta hydrolase n=1 Tax=Methylovulum psychrotolerans TaxID=1704499 RepID=UPI001BFFB772|nr:alpha/beta hydrolase [Methylovulum psychrotolerans]MBT9099918.1 alpha/beta hydrolase [Methylovulum psychrotolerans]
MPKFPLYLLIRRLLIGLGVALVLVVFAAWQAGSELIKPAAWTVGDAPADLPGVTVHIPLASGGAVAGWWLQGQVGQGVVLLLHGVRADRRAMSGRAQFLRQAGYSVLLVDLPAHGESTGQYITFGVNEGEAVKAMLAYLRRQVPGEKVGVIGVSLGAAAAVLAKATPPPDAVVLESMFPTIEDAVTDRMVHYFGPLGRGVAPLLLWQLPWRLGISAGQLHPIAEIGALAAPVLVASGTEDPLTTLAETQRIFAAAKEPKQFWAVEGAAHGDLHAYNPAAYQAKILPFLAAYLPRKVVP